MTLNGKPITVKGNVTVAEIFKIDDEAQFGGTKVSAVVPSWNTAVLVHFIVPKGIAVKKGTRLMVEANLGALYAEDVCPKYLEKITA